jgi:hypothetical protein
MRIKKQTFLKSKSKTSDYTGHKQNLKPGGGQRMRARRILCGFSTVLTEREKLALLWLAQGLAARVIAKRLDILREPRSKIPGGARSLPLRPLPARSRGISAPRPSFERQPANLTDSGPLDANAL